MLIRWEDKDWTFQASDLTNRQAIALETEMGMSIAEFYDLLEGDDGEGFDSAKPYFVKLMTILYWLMLDQNGQRVKISDVEFPLIGFAQAFAAAMAAELATQPAAPAEGAPDPTRPVPGSAPSAERSSRSEKTPAAAGSPHG